MAPPTKFAHVVFGTYRYPEMVRFYETTFESRIQSQTPALTFMTYDDEHHRHAIADLGSPPEGYEPGPHGVGVHHLGYTWASITDLMGVYRRVRDDLGVLPLYCTRHGPTLSMYYEDPDGNRLEFQVDLLDPDQANEFMATDAFAANPRGEPFDPDELCRRLESGEPVEDLVLRSDQARVPISV